MATRPTLSPTVRHKRLTAELRRLRAESGLTREAVAERFDWHPTKITRIEKGQWSRLNLRDVRELLETYGVTDESQRESLVQLARDVRQRGWWQSYSNVLPNEYTHFIGL
ncbi:MAG TPA: helix-turn-helix transcriptional regulator, partial [Streptosporangiaceae bacterium]